MAVVPGIFLQDEKTSSPRALAWSLHAMVTACFASFPPWPLEGTRLSTHESWKEDQVCQRLRKGLYPLLLHVFYTCHSNHASQARKKYARKN
jgi:hypothetical protein